MNIIQTFYSYGRNPLRNKFGWYASRYHIMSWALSCHTISRFYPNLTLYSDSTGQRLLIDRLNLPYKNVITLPDEINAYPRHFWGLAKLMTYSMQRKAFVHIDGDVYLWKRLNNKLLGSPLIVQNLEQCTNRYEQNLNWTTRHLSYLPRLLKNKIRRNIVCSCNAGVIGGSDITFFNRFAREWRAIVDRNDISRLPRAALANLNVIVEQVLFYQLASREKKAINCLIEKVIPDFGYTYYDFADFSLAGSKLHYIHLIGGHKRTLKTCEMMERQLRHEFPATHRRITALFR
jgi:hypothetical protein